MRAVTGSHTGTGVWLLQRGSAVLLALALPLIAVYVLQALPLDFAGWRLLWAPLWTRVLLVLTAAALALHAWVGMRDIFMDYVHHTGLRLLLSLTVVTVLATSVAWLLAVLFGGQIWGTS